MKGQEVKENDERFEKLFNAAPEPMVLLDEMNCVVDVNSRFEDVFSYKLENVMGEDVNELLVPDELRDEGEKLDDKSEEGYFNYETVREGKSREIPVSVSGSLIKINGDPYTIVTYKVIEKRKKAEKNIKIFLRILLLQSGNKIFLRSRITWMIWIRKLMILKVIWMRIRMKFVIV